MRGLIMCAGAALMLAGCAGPGYVGRGSIAYDGYYDNAYGPIYDGYWGDGDVFFYRSRPHGHYMRDTGHHFRHDASDGYRSMHVNGPAYHGHGRRGDRDRHHDRH